MIRTFVTDEVAAAIESACVTNGAGATVALGVIVSLEEARCTEELVKMLLAGRAVPVILGGQLRYTLSQSARDELAGKLSAAAVRDFTTTERA